MDIAAPGGIAHDPEQLGVHNGQQHSRGNDEDPDAPAYKSCLIQSSVAIAGSVRILPTLLGQQLHLALLVFVGTVRTRTISHRNTLDIREPALHVHLQSPD